MSSFSGCKQYDPVIKMGKGDSVARKDKLDFVDEAVESAALQEKKKNAGASNKASVEQANWQSVKEMNSRQTCIASSPKTRASHHIAGCRSVFSKVGCSVHAAKALIIVMLLGA